MPKNKKLNLNITDDKIVHIFMKRETADFRKQFIFIIIISHIRVIISNFRQK